MSRNRGYPTIEIIELNRDDLSAYVKAKVILSDGEIILRWGLDDYTYKKIKNVIETRHFDNLPGIKYQFKLIPSYTGENIRVKKTVLLFIQQEVEKKQFSSLIEVLYRHETKSVPFKCSETYAGNIEWLKKVKSISELKHMEWK